MTHIRTTAHFEAPIERVFELATDYKRLPEWNVNYVEVPEVLGPTNQVGTRIHTIMKLLNRRMDGWAEVGEVEAPRMIKLIGRGTDGGTVSAVYRFTPAGLATDVEAEIDYELPAGPFGQIVDRLFVEHTVERDLRHSMENFKALVEARQPALV